MPYFSFNILALVVTLALSPTGIYAARFTLNPAPASEQNATEQGKVAIPDSKQLVATGYGINEEQALRMAFRTAIEQYVGVVVDSKTIVKNSTLIDDSLLTASNGFIQTYEKISTSKQDGLVMVKILATVKTQQLVENIHKLKIATMQLTGSADIAARIETKQIAKEDALKILNKAWDEAWGDQAKLDILTINIDSVKVQEEKAKEGKVPMVINYTIGVNMPKYEATVTKLEHLFKQLGAKQLKRYDMPKMHGTFLRSSNVEKLAKFPQSSISFLKHYGQGFVVDVWEFPTSWNVKNCIGEYLFGDKNHKSSRHQMYIEIKKSDGSIAYATSFIPKPVLSFFWGSLNLMKSSAIIDGRYMVYSDMTCNNWGVREVVSPVFFGYGDPFWGPKESIKGTVTISLNIEKVKDVKDISLVIEPH